VKELQTKAYVADTNKAVEAVPIGLIASVGEVDGQRIALLDDFVSQLLGKTKEVARSRVSGSFLTLKRWFCQTQLAINLRERQAITYLKRIAELRELSSISSLHPIDFAKNRRMIDVR
jgi:hypothetical protein